MKVFVAGASGAIGRPLIAKLIRKGQAVTGMTYSEGHSGVAPGRDKPPQEAGLGVPVAQGLLRFSFVRVSHPRTDVELGHTFGIPEINLALADLIPGT